MAQGSLVSRLIWLLASSMAALWILGSVAAGTLTVFEINERLDDAIEEVAQRLLPATYEAVRQPEAMQQMAKQLVATMDPRALAYQIVGPTGEIAMRSENAPETPFPVPRQAGFHDTPQYRVYAQPAAADGYFIEVAEPRAHRAESLWRATGGSPSCTAARARRPGARGPLGRSPGDQGRRARPPLHQRQVAGHGFQQGSATVGKGLVCLGDEEP